METAVAILAVLLFLAVIYWALGKFITGAMLRTGGLILALVFTFYVFLRTA